MSVRVHVTLAILSLLCIPGLARAQSGAVDLCVTVPDILALTLPPAPSALLHDGSSSLSSFGALPFSIICNDPDGATVTFQTATGFVHSIVPTIQRDCILGLALGSASPTALWTVTTAADQTDVSSVPADNSALVQAQSSAPGVATLDLTVAMDSGDLGTLISGTYCVSVVATLTAN